MVVGCHAGEGAVACLFAVTGFQMSAPKTFDFRSSVWEALDRERVSELDPFHAGSFAGGWGGQPVRTSCAISLSFRNGTGGWEVVLLSVAMFFAGFGFFNLERPGGAAGLTFRGCSSIDGQAQTCRL